MLLLQNHLIFLHEMSLLLQEDILSMLVELHIKAVQRQYFLQNFFRNQKPCLSVKKHPLKFDDITWTIPTQIQEFC